MTYKERYFDILQAIHNLGVCGKNNSMGLANYSKCCDCDYFTKKNCVVELYNKLCGIMSVAKNDCEIIKCKDCEAYNHIGKYCMMHSASIDEDDRVYFYVDDYDYCSFAKRKDYE